MTALTQDIETQYRDGVELDFPMVASDIIYGGSWVAVNAAGYALPGSDTAGLIFGGIATQRVDNSAGAAGAKSVVLKRKGTYKATMATAISQANVGDNVYLVDDNLLDVAANTTNDILCGKIRGYIDSTHAWVDIDSAT